MNALRVLATKFKEQSLLAMIVEVVGGLLAYEIFVAPLFVYARLFWCVPLATAAGLFLAHRKWPRVKLRHYVSSRKAVLPAVCAVGGWGLQYVLLGLGIGPASTTAMSMLAGGPVAASALGVVMMIFEGKLMKDIFELVPADQRAALQTFLAGSDPAAGAGGQSADFSKLDPSAVAIALKARVVGQDRVVDDVVATAFRRAQLTRPNKPLATFLFVGPTGVGKSELAKAVAHELFAGRVTTLACNQLKEKADLWSVVGPPRGYMGSDQGGKLCRELGALGTGVLVLDEFEKAHPDVLEALMRLLDEGKLTENSTGNVYSARGFIIVGTSNAAAEEVGKLAAAEKDPDALARKVRKALVASGLKPEIVARFDQIFPFRPLDRTDVARVVGVMVQRHAAAAGVQVTALDADLLVDLIHKQEAGADAGMRNLDRAVERQVLDGMLAARNAGAKAVAIHVRDGQVQVTPVGGQAVEGGAA